MFESLFNQKTMYIDSSGLVMRNLLARQEDVLQCFNPKTQPVDLIEFLLGCPDL